MGNISAKSNDAKDTSGLDDYACLDIQNYAIFNDSFVLEKYPTLPEYEGTELIEKSEEKIEIKSANPKLKRLLEIFGKNAGDAPPLEDFKDLLSAAESSEVDFMNMMRMRSRLLQRIQIAYKQQLDVVAKATNSHKEDLFLTPNDNGGSGFNDANALLTATSIRMSLSIMACLGPQNPTLFREFALSLADLLLRSPPLAFSQILSGSPQAESVRAIVEHCVLVISQSSGGMQMHIVDIPTY